MIHSLRTKLARALHFTVVEFYIRIIIIIIINLHVCTEQQQYQGTFLLFQTDAHNYKIIGILKQNSDYRCDVFQFTQEPSSGSYFVLS
jgi:hypothetical protein